MTTTTWQMSYARGPSSRDKYGFKDLKPGESKTVFGVTMKKAQVMESTYSRRYEWMCHREFVRTAVNGGVKIERVR